MRLVGGFWVRVFGLGGWEVGRLGWEASAKIEYFYVFCILGLYCRLRISFGSLGGKLNFTGVLNTLVRLTSGTMFYSLYGKSVKHTTLVLNSLLRRRIYFLWFFVV